jgi:hypothetical protein
MTMTNLKVKPFDCNGTDKAIVSTDNAKMVTEYAKVDGEHLKLGYDGVTMMDIHVGSVEEASEAKNAVRRAKQYNEEWNNAARAKHC